MGRKKTWERNKKLKKLHGKVAHTSKADRDKAVRQTPESVRVREETETICTKVIKRRVITWLNAV